MDGRMDGLIDGWRGGWDDSRVFSVIFVEVLYVVHISVYILGSKTLMGLEGEM